MQIQLLEKYVDGLYHHMTSNGKEYNIVFERRNNITNLKKEAREYINK